MLGINNMNNMNQVLKKVGGALDLERFNSVSAVQVNRNLINQE
jgi:hypothetical protein